MTLTPKQEKFCTEYVRLGSAAEAYRSAYDVGADTLPKTVWEQASRVMGTEAVAQRIMEIQAAAAERAEITVAQTLRELGKIGFADIREAFDDDGRLLAVKALPDSISAAVQSIDVVRRNITSGDGETDLVYRIKLWDKNSALEKIGRHLAMFVERQELSGPRGGKFEVDFVPPRTDMDRMKAIMELARKVEERDA